jgi:hypothetical protein
MNKLLLIEIIRARNMEAALFSLFPICELFKENSCTQLASPYHCTGWGITFLGLVTESCIPRFPIPAHSSWIQLDSRWNRAFPGGTTNFHLVSSWHMLAMRIPAGQTLTSMWIYVDLRGFHSQVD